MINLLVFIGSILFAQDFAYAKNSDIKVNKATQIVMDTTSINGEKTVRFTIKKENEKNFISMTSNTGDSKVKILSLNDVDFIKQEFEKLPVPEKVPNECNRSKMTVTWINMSKTPVIKESCLGVNTITEPAYARFAQILVNAL